MTGNTPKLWTPERYKILHGSSAFCRLNRPKHYTHGFFHNHLKHLWHPHQLRRRWQRKQRLLRYCLNASHSFFMYVRRLSFLFKYVLLNWHRIFSYRPIHTSHSRSYDSLWPTWFCRRFFCVASTLGVHDVFMEGSFVLRCIIIIGDFLRGGQGLDVFWLDWNVIYCLT